MGEPIDPADPTAQIPFRVLGRVIGTGTGFDIHDDGVSIYDFIPKPNSHLDGIGLLGKTLSIYNSEGLFKVFGDEGEVKWQRDIIEVLRDWPADAQEANWSENG